MDARSLKTLLRTLREHGVSSYRDADVTVEFGATLAAPEGDIEGEPDDLMLPPGTPNPIPALDAIRKAYATKQKRGST